MTTPTPQPQTAALPSGQQVAIGAPGQQGAYNPGQVVGQPGPSTLSTVRYAWFPKQMAPAQTGVKHVGGEEIPIQVRGPVKVGGGRVDLDTAKALIGEWSPEQLAAFRNDAVGMGLVDGSATYGQLQSLWNDLVDESASALQFGQKVSPFEAMQEFAAQVAEKQKKEGPTYQHLGETTARGALEGAMGTELGRTIASPGEVGQFQGGADPAYVAAQKHNQTFDTGTAATEYVREHHGTEAGSTSALKYYDVLMQMASGQAG